MRRSHILVGLVVLGSLCLRVIPSWHVVFTHAGVSFQENDAWFHVRTIHNLLAHFPLRSSFDPYMRFPGGGEVPTGPLWDYAVASIAWALRLKADLVAAWLPAICGALLPMLSFRLADRLFGRTAALFAALWTAVIPGALLWATHLGLADHHAAETLLALVALVCVCEGAEGGGKLFTIGGGVALGAYLATRPNGIFVPAMLACGVLLAPAAAPTVLRATAIAAAISFFCTGPTTWLALAAAAAASLAAMLPAGKRAVLCAVAAVLAAVLRPYWFAVVLWQVRRYGGHLDSTATVQELAPLLRSHGSSALGALFYQLGSLWMVGLPALVWTIGAAFQKRRPALTLFAVWSIAMTAGAFLQVRMTIYFAPAAAVAAGAACAWVARERKALVAAVTVLIVATNLPFSLDQMKIDGGPSADYREALGWLRANSPEPLGDAAAWYRRYSSADAFVWPASAYGVATVWESGYWVEELAHRMPSANGTQAGSREMAAFLTSADAQSAMESLGRLGAQYVVVDPRTPFFGAVGRSYFPTLLLDAQRDTLDFYRVLMQEVDGQRRPLVAYLPRYYRTMAARLYLADGEAVRGGNVWVFETAVENGRENVIGQQQFASESEALAFVQDHRDRSLVMACIDPGRSCVDVDAVPGVRRVFSSDPLPISPERPIRAVKVFEVAR